MTSYILVCPYSDRLLSRLEGEVLAIKTSNQDEIIRIAQDVNHSKNYLYCILLFAKASLSDISFHEDWRNIPLALYAYNIGPFHLFVSKLPIIRGLDLRVYLPIDREENYINLRILSSLGIASILLFGEKNQIGRQ